MMNEYRPTAFHGLVAGLLVGFVAALGLLPKPTTPAIVPSPISATNAARHLIPELPTTVAATAIVTEVAELITARSVVGLAGASELSVRDLVVAGAADAPIATNQGQLRLAWNRSPDLDVAGYALYYGEASGEYSHRADVRNVTNTTLRNLKEGASYYIAAVAYSTNGAESSFSNEALGVTGFSIFLRRDVFSVESIGRLAATNQIQTSSNLIDWRTLLEWTGTGRMTNILSTNTQNAFFRVRVK